MFEEITLTDGITEIMVHRDCDTRKFIRMYTYADCLEGLKMDLGAFSLKYVPSKRNDLFVDVKSKNFREIVSFLTEELGYILIEDT